MGKVSDMTHSTPRRLLVGVLGMMALACGGPQAHAATLTCRDLPMLYERFMSQHYPVNADEATIRQRTADQFVKVIDPSKTLLLDKDVVTVKQGLAGGFANGQCPQLDKTYDLIAQRTQDNESMA